MQKMTYRIPREFFAFLDLKEDYKIIRSVKDSTCSIVEKYSTYLKDLYQSMVGKSLAPFKLAQVEKNETMDSRECDDFTKSTLRGDLDDVVYTKRPFNEGEIGLLPIREKCKQP